MGEYFFVICKQKLSRKIKTSSCLWGNFQKIKKSSCLWGNIFCYLQTKIEQKNKNVQLSMGECFFVTICKGKC